MTAASVVISVAAILAVATVFSMIGLGGGVLYVPVLVALGMAVHDATATSLFVIVATSVSAAIIYSRRRTVDWKLAMIIEPPTLIMAFLGGLIANYIEAEALKVVFAAVLMIASIIMIRPVKERDPGDARGWGSWRRRMGGREYEVRLPLLMPITGVAGFIAGMIGIAGGVFKLPAMVMVGHVPVRIAIGTSAFMVGITAAAGLSGHIVSGSFDVLIALPLAAAAFVGGRIGPSLSLRARERGLRLFAAWLLFSASVWMIVSTLI